VYWDAAIVVADALQRLLAGDEFMKNVKLEQRAPMTPKRRRFLISFSRARSIRRLFAV
jgi:hypothetical protein